MITVTMLIWININESSFHFSAGKYPFYKAVQLRKQRLPVMKCHPVNNVVFIKTHKTASTSLHCIICRYGYNKKLSFVICKFNMYNGHIRKTALNTSRFLPPLHYNGTGNPMYNILTGHVTYAKRTINTFMSGKPKFITIVREPASQIESHMNFFHHKSEVLSGIDTFLKDVNYFQNGGTAGSRNNQIRDLGLTLIQTANETIVNDTINKLDEEFDLVLIAEYFDESLILLKRLMCWEFEDIVYLAKNTRLKRDTITNTFRRNVYKWSRADMLMYNYFNFTLWSNIRGLGSEFYVELATFRALLTDTSTRCSASKISKRNRSGVKHIEYSTSNTTFCKQLGMTNVDWYQSISKRQQ
ncbi:galactosylceramide sulfotransferase-like [Saccoglossus kowalevskii]|uniref:Galactosylceramide sulfotransferase-like n=1 Tax=Saccoglossus kowalevskii TaxID=10224 RepID=A0ABM0M7G9_SACKO|nr:PREDICTED: galactosylceramide sulfotransferase-like [Saccoglossus kowalevskii]